VVKSQEEALASGQVYDYCLLTTKCLPDIAPNHKLLAPALVSKQIKSYALIQNGLDIEKDLYAALQENGQVEDVPIVTAAAWIGLMTSPDGKRIIWAGPRVRLEVILLDMELIDREEDSLLWEHTHLRPRTLRHRQRRRDERQLSPSLSCWKKAGIRLR